MHRLSKFDQSDGPLLLVSDGPLLLVYPPPSRCYMLLARPGPKVNLTAQSIEWKINMAGVETSDENDSSEELVPKKKCTSEIWQYFGFNREDVSQMQVLCKSYQKTVVTSRGNTTNLHSHPEHNRRELYEDFRKCKAKTTKTANEKPSNNKRTYRQPSIKVLQMQYLTEKF